MSILLILNYRDFTFYAPLPEYVYKTQNITFSFQVNQKDPSQIKENRYLIDIELIKPRNPYKELKLTQNYANLGNLRIKMLK